ncbi:MAG: NAD(P)-binding protein [Deltaproteobacteria bacterium]|nr:NAD(P)-binding protein [Deltaproteobacteria bacterium]
MAQGLLRTLPQILAERVRPLTSAPPVGAFVLVWCRCALRGHENPVIDVALAAGDSLGLPVFVVQGLSERHPYMNDRHATFMLECARDLHAELAARGIGSALHVERPGHRGPHLITLGQEAALIVVDECPVPPLRQWTDALARQVTAPVWAVDAANVVPSPLVPKGVDRAFSFRERTAALRAERLRRPWADHPVHRPSFTPDLPFIPVNPAELDIPSLVAACDIDHSVGPVFDTPGGARAGYARWEQFKRRGLARYHRDRDDPTLDGVSRLSAYLHYGAVSPLRVAREAAELGGEGPEKFLDELLIWRELAASFCANTPDVEALDALPAWAQATLRRHAQDPRPQLISPERLARGRSGDALWDLAQQSLVVHGELHNNLRMTWGKALLQWTPSPEAALGQLIELNHRYALDGRDPSSTGGLLWCLGLFDRPFQPEAPVIGEVRPRPLAQHAARVDLPRLRQRVSRPRTVFLPRVAVIGAGVAGLACARTLHDHGLPVVVFDKARGPGGRVSTRRAEGGGFDHGALYFTARDPRFRRVVESWIADGLVAPWEGRFVRLKAGGEPSADLLQTERFVGVDRMSAIPRHLATELELVPNLRVTTLHHDGRRFTLIDEAGGVREGFDVVVVAVPAPQAAPLLVLSPALAARAAEARLDPCQAVMLRLGAPLELGFDAARVEGSPLGYAARDSSKPGRAPGERWVLHGARAWSAAHLEDSPELVISTLVGAFSELTGAEVHPVEATAHRWRYALAAGPFGEAALWDNTLGLGACGDWCVGPRVEAAYLSGVAMAGRVLGRR